MFDRARLKLAFDLLGEDLARRGLFVELAVCGGSATLLQFDSRRATEDVDAVVRPGHDESTLGPSVRSVADRMGLSPDWLNNAVGMFTPLQEDDALFEASGTYPLMGPPALRVLLAKPRYLLAMKLHALANLDRGDRDLADARLQTLDLNITEAEELRHLVRTIHGEEPSDDIVRQFASVLRHPIVMRPTSLAEVAERSGADPDWRHHLDEFLDTFYVADGDIARQTSMIAETPRFIGDARADAFLGGVGEHLARRWGLPIPTWVRADERYLDQAMFVPDRRGFRGYLLVVSPVAFRTRLIFTGPDPLQRARFPYHRGVIRVPLDYPATTPAVGNNDR